MKKIFVFLSAILLSAFAFADSTTSRMGLTKPSIGSSSWGTKVNSNYDITDASSAVLGANNTYTAGNYFGTRPWVDIVAYGADLTGASDSTTAIQNAINTGYDVFIPTGTFKITSGIASGATGQAIFGVGPNSKILYVSGSTAVTTLDLTHSYMTLRNFTIDGSSATVPFGGGRGLIRTELGAVGITIDNVNILNSPNTGLALDGCSQCLVTNSKITNAYEHGLYATELTGLRFMNNILTQNGLGSGGNTLKIKTDRSIYSGNYISSAAATSAVVDFENGDSGYDYQGNTFSNNVVIGSRFLGTALLTMRPTTETVKTSEIIGNYWEMNVAASSAWDLRGGSVKAIGNEFNMNHVAAGAIVVTSTYSFSNSQLIGNSIHGGSSATAISISSGSNIMVNMNSIVDFSGGVGILMGTNTATSDLRFNKFSNVTTNITDSGTNNIVNVISSNVVTNSVVYGQSDGTVKANATLSYNSSSGNVGIGTSTAVDKLTVVIPGSDVGITLTDASLNFNPAFLIKRGGSTRLKMDCLSSQGHIYGTGSNGLFLGGSDSAEDVRITAAGVTTIGGSGSLTTNFAVNGSSSTGSGGGTLTNAPSAGNPVGYLDILVNGTARHIPFW